MLNILPLLLSLVALPLVESPHLTLDTHVFLSQGLIYSRGANFLADSKDLSADFSEAGINFVSDVPDDNIKFGVQLFSRRLGPEGAFVTKFDWFYLDYTPLNWLGFKVGRIKLPFGLYNDSSDIDSARPFVLLPQSLYPIKNRNFLLAANGAELHGLIHSIEYAIYGGTIPLDTLSLATPGVIIEKIGTPYLIGARLMWDTPIPGLRLSASSQALKLNANLLIPLPTGTTRLELRVPGVLWVGSAEYSMDDLKLAAEYSRWTTTIESNNDALVQSSKKTSERFYVSASYYVTDWLEPGAYVAVSYADVDHREGRAAKQFDYAGVMRFNVNSYWLFKLEGHYMRGTLTLDPLLNDSITRTNLPNEWGVVLAKTTLFF